jgi:hypothetical protein
LFVPIWIQTGRAKGEPEKAGGGLAASCVSFTGMGELF